MTVIPVEWPPTLASYKVDLKLPAEDVRYDGALQATLESAIAYVERVRTDVNFEGAFPSVLTPITMDLVIGTLRLARRWDLRRDTPTGMMVAGQVGTTGMAPWDADVEKLLRIGRYARIRFA